MWRSLMVDEYGKSVAKSGGIGIADQVLAQMIKLQEVN
ncbi:rod-binding protein [Pseudomonadota bacterium]